MSNVLFPLSHFKFIWGHGKVGGGQEETESHHKSTVCGVKCVSQGSTPQMVMFPCTAEFPAAHSQQEVSGWPLADMPPGGLI